MFLLMYDPTNRELLKVVSLAWWLTVADGAGG